MSHIVQIQTEVKDVAAIGAACRRLGLAEPVYGPVRLFSGEKTGWAVQLPGWRYPVVCEVGTGKLDYDDYGGRWGDRVQLDRFLQAYAVERAQAEARRKGYSVTEQALEDGSIRLQIKTSA